MALKLRSLVLPFIMGLALASCGKKEVKHLNAKSTRVSIREVSYTPQVRELSYSGTIEPDNTVQVGFAVPGVVNNIMVEEGQRISKGQVLATIDNSEYANALAIANAGLEQAEDMYQRLDGLYKKGSLPEKDYIDIKTKLAQAKANKSINAKRIKDSRLYAPMSGIITGKMIERGSAASPGVPAFTIVKTDEVYARISVPESEVGSMRVGMKADVFIPTLDRSLTGKISIINPQADPVSKTYSLKIKIANASGLLLPGMLTETKINTGKPSNVITVPASSIIRDPDGLTYVFVSNENKKAIQKRVTTTTVTGNKEVIITQGLSTGEKLVVAGQTRLKDGDALAF